MRFRLMTTRARFLVAGSIAAVSGSTFAHQQATADPTVVVSGQRPVAGPELKGIVSARHGDKIKITSADGANTIVTVDDATQIRSGGGLFGGGRKTLRADALPNGLPVTVKTLQAPDGSPGTSLVAAQISFRNGDLKTAAMIRGATDQRFEEQAAATESLRGRIGDIDKYNIKSTINVHFNSGKSDLSPQGKADLCATATSAQATENALILVVGYTDSTGGDDLNQALSEKRAARVINYLQQTRGWKAYRLLTPTGMSKADPLAGNDTAEGKAQNRRVAVNILVSKSVDGM